MPPFCLERVIKSSRRNRDKKVVFYCVCGEGMGHAIRTGVIVDRIKEKYHSDFEAFKETYAKAVLDSVPAHLRKVKEYELQFVFHSDGWFLLHCIVTLLNNGKLKEPTTEQKKALTTLILPN